jgi:ribosomal-protein-alanine N-acetyltransferase
MELHTSRLLLRDFTPVDVNAVHEYQSDPRYLAHASWRTRSRADVADFLQMMIEWSLARPRVRYQLAIVRDGLVIGTCGVRTSAPGALEGDFGCELAPAAWGQGYAAEASRAILAFGFSELRLQRIIARTTRANTAAIRLARRLGMRGEAGAQPPEGSDQVVLLGISDHEWNGAVSEGL